MSEKSSNGYIVEALLLMVTFLSNVYTPSFFPMPVKMITPSLGWCCMMIVIASNGLFAALLVTALLGGVALKLFSNDEDSLLLRRFIYFPLVASLPAILAGSFTYLPNPTLVFWVSLVSQLYSILCGVLIALCYPSLIYSTVVSQKGRDRDYENLLVELRENSRCTAERVLISAAMGLELDTVLIRPPKPSEKWMLYLKGNGEFLEHMLQEMVPFSQQLEANVIICHPRGVGRSTGYPIRVQDFVDDAASVAAFYAHQYGFLEENLLLLGHSFGGGIAAELAQKHFPRSPLVIDRSFSRLSDSVGSFTGKLRFIICPLSKMLVGDLSTIHAWNEIHHENKLIIFARRDEVIDFEKASIARLPQFQCGESEDMKTIELHSRRTSSWHNSNLTSFDEGSLIILRMNGFYPSIQ